MTAPAAAPADGPTDGPAERTRFEPPESEAARPFWAASRDRRLVLQWCRTCEQPVHYPRDACPRCLGDQLEFRSSRGLGTVYAVSVMPKPANPLMAGREPYAVALIDLHEGVRMMSNVVAIDPGAVQVGMAVRVTWEPLSDDRYLPQFEPDDSSTTTATATATATATEER